MRSARGAVALAWHDELPRGWDDWVERSQHVSFAARSGFLEALAAFPGGGRARLLAASRDGELRAALPVFVSRRFGRTWARSLPFGTYGGPLLAPSLAEDGEESRVLAGGFADWMREARVAGGEVVFGPRSREEAPPASWCALAQATTRALTHVIALDSGIEALRNDLRRETKKGFRKAEREGVRIEESPDALAAVHALYLAQASRWGVRRPYPLDFLSRLVAHPSGFARHFVARREGELLAGVLALTGGRETFLWWSGSAPEARTSLAFPLLLWTIAERAAAHGAVRLNIGSSAGRAPIERFKESLGAVPRTIWIHHLRPQGFDPAARLLVWARALARRG